MENDMLNDLTGNVKERTWFEKFLNTKYYKGYRIFNALYRFSAVMYVNYLIVKYLFF